MVLNQTVLKKDDSQMAAVRLDSLSIYRNSSVAWLWEGPGTIKSKYQTQNKADAQSKGSADSLLK